MSASGLIDGRFPVELIAGGLLSWHEVWSVRLVSKSFYAAADRDRLHGVWDTVVEVLSSKNRSNGCEMCEEDWKECNCEEYRLWLEDPRVGRTEDRASLEGDARLVWDERTPYSKAVSLLRFQRMCVSNLLGFHARLNPIGYTFEDEAPPYIDDRTFPAKVFEAKYKLRWDLVADLAQLALAEEELESTNQYWYRTTFKGIDLDLAAMGGSSFRDSFCSVVRNFGENLFDDCTEEDPGVQIEYAVLKDWISHRRGFKWDESYRERAEAANVRFYAVLGPRCAFACDIFGQRMSDILAADDWEEWEEIMEDYGYVEGEDEDEGGDGGGEAA